ncbi:hypothetical protein CFC21_016301 [Triticum aestivum]|uniref:Uncharacterized protein n=3 Tax=Triticum TaxID=4564 RepID=A0A9R1DY69_WHEAT|nr:uncharacterized protein LOC123185077 [Triticum aestivum]KAF7000379.1 hypothetical protein CFC21_016299 [Triticum aestivum]KAF7000381.1 hypothetical protein CFC21_016301 [Triticum aestivum]
MRRPSHDRVPPPVLLILTCTLHITRRHGGSSIELHQYLSPKLPVVREKTRASEMPGRNLGAAGAKKEEGEHARLPKIDVQTLYVLYMVLFMMIWMSLFRFRYPQHAEFLRYTPAVEALAACFFFTFVTLMLQALLANALSEKAAPSPLPPPVNHWIMALSVWLFGVLYYLVYASMNDGYAAEPGYSGLLIAGVASVVSLAMTVYNMRQRPVFA